MRSVSEHRRINLTSFQCANNESKGEGCYNSCRSFVADQLSRAGRIVVHLSSPVRSLCEFRLRAVFTCNGVNHSLLKQVSYLNCHKSFGLVGSIVISHVNWTLAELDLHFLFNADLLSPRCPETSEYLASSKYSHLIARCTTDCASAFWARQTPNWRTRGRHAICHVIVFAQHTPIKLDLKSLERVYSSLTT